MDNNDKYSDGKPRLRFSRGWRQPKPAAAVPEQMIGIKRNIFSHLLMRLEKTQISGGMNWSEATRRESMSPGKQAAQTASFNQKDTKQK